LDFRVVRSMRWSIVPALVLALVLSGCFGGAPVVEGPTDEAPRLSLADLTCDFMFPDNATPVPCTSEFAVAEEVGATQPRAGDQWLCIHESDVSVVHQIPYWLHWNPAAGVHGLFYSVPPEFLHQGLTVGGLFYTNDGAVRVAWHGAGAEGFIELPQMTDRLDSVQFFIRIYTHGYTTPTEALGNGTVHAIWTMYNDFPYPVQAVTANGNAYYFHNVTTSADPNFPYSVQSFSLAGEDFEITVEARHLLNRVDAFTNYPLHQCTF
jgi:hypothetical protein